MTSVAEVRVRGAGGLLVGVAVYPLVFTLDVYSQRAGGIDFVEAVRDRLWYPEGMARPPGDRLAFIILRDVLLFVALVAGALGVAGSRASRIPIVVSAAGIALGVLPSIVYDPFNYTSDRPPDWVFENQLWFLSGRWSGVVWFGICVAAIVLALTDLGTREEAVPFGAPGGGYDAATPTGGPPLQPQPSHWGQPMSTGPSAAPPPPPTTRSPTSTSPEGLTSPVSPKDD